VPRVLLSLYALSLGAQPSAVGLLVASYFAFPLALSWPIGVLSDRIGARGLLLFGSVCGAGGMLVPYYVHSMPALYFAGMMIGLSFVFSNVLLQNLVGILSKPNERMKNFSNSSLVGSATNFLGPLVAGLAIDHSGHAIACLYVVALAFTATLLLVFWGGVLPGAQRHTAVKGSARDTLTDPAIVRILISSSLVQVGQDLYQFYLPVYSHGIGLSASAIGAILATFASATFVVRIIMQGLIKRLGEQRVLSYSFYLAAAGFILVPFFRSPIALAMVSFMFGLGMGCGQPITTMLLFSRSAQGRSGETLGLRQTANNIVRVIAPSLFGFVATAFGLMPVFGISALMMASGGLITRTKLRRDTSR
jgi:MFS family permease